ncbi:MAG: VOC family protein [Chloroflexi bacterium]|nr:VOC family protein [Chloroflexota bacterium]
MPRVLNLGHVGVFVRNIDKMEAFYRDFLGMTVTKRNADGTAVFLSGDPETVDHEIALMSGRPEQEDPKLIQQISMRVSSLADVREFHRRAKEAGYRIQRTVSHASAVGCYMFDPEGNVVETFWLTGKTSWAVTAVPVDLDGPEDAILEVVERHWQQTKDVKMGERPKAPAIV